MRRLARFRADPARVRVSIRRVKDYWTVFVQTKGSEAFVVATNYSAEFAIANALEKAEESCMVGIDLGMESTYPHPQFST